MTPRPRCTARHCMLMATHKRPALCDDHFREYRIRNAQARREIKAAAHARAVAAAINLLRAEGYEVSKKSVNERTLP